jgi:hypothetical protein
LSASLLTAVKYLGNPQFEYGQHFIPDTLACLKCVERRESYLFEFDHKLYQCIQMLKPFAKYHPLALDNAWKTYYLPHRPDASDHQATLMTTNYAL